MERGYNLGVVVQEKFPNLLISVQVLDGKPLAEQAAVYSNASIVIQAHGAALGEHTARAYPAIHAQGGGQYLERLNYGGKFQSCST